jgi:hypothetical protein
LLLSALALFKTYPFLPFNLNKSKQSGHDLSRNQVTFLEHCKKQFLDPNTYAYGFCFYLNLAAAEGYLSTQEAMEINDIIYRNKTVKTNPTSGRLGYWFVSHTERIQLIDLLLNNKTWKIQ